MQFTGFDWDLGNRGKCQKHGVSPREIEDLFLNTVLFKADVKHSAKEERLLAFGTTKEGRKLLVAFTLRSKNGEIYIRPVSARYMHRKEAIYYEKETSDPEKRR